MYTSYIFVSYFSATANESLKLMLVGLQKRGKTTLLARLTELNEIEQVATTYNSRNSGETPAGLSNRSNRNAVGMCSFNGHYTTMHVVCRCTYMHTEMYRTL